MIQKIVLTIVGIIWCGWFAYMPFAGKPHGVMIGFSLLNVLFCMFGGVIMLKTIWKD